MRQITKLFLALAIVASPLTFTSCDDDSLYSGNDYYDDLVANAVQNYYRVFPNGSSNTAAYNWFITYYPDAYTSELEAFMNAIGGDIYWDDYNNGRYVWNNNYNQRQESQNNSLLEEARTLTGEWEGSMVYEYTDDSTKKRVSDQFKANMKFFQYNSSANSLGGNGVEVDTNAKGDQQTLAFSWYVNTDGNIYIKYTKSGNIFVLDSKSDKNGFHLGYEKEKGYDTFFGTAFSTNTTDVLRFDLARQQPASAKATNGLTRAANQATFGAAKKNDFAKYSTDAVNRLHVR